MRCSRCVLPDTTPGISFNKDQVCNYCLEKYPNYTPKGSSELFRILSSSNNTDATADCLVGLSGGKDSTYALIKLKEDYGQRVEAFTYVHEGSADFSVQNAINICKELNVKHHIVSLKKQKHLKTFKGFFKAWLLSPSTTTAGLTCVACKHLHLLGFELARKRNIPNIVWSTSPLEYSPFLALKYKHTKEDQFARESNKKGALLLLKEMFSSLRFPYTFFKYLRTSTLGCLAAFPSSPYLKRTYPDIRTIMFYDYENWHPSEIKEYIKNYNWGLPSSIGEDWHSDCQFNIFKEYMFQSELGVSYTDAFLSNQIRYGIISREEAMKKLISSKEYYSEQIIETMKILKMQKQLQFIDTSCFKVKK